MEIGDHGKKVWFVSIHILDLDLSVRVMETGWTGYNHCTLTFQWNAHVKILVVRVNGSGFWLFSI